MDQFVNEVRDRGSCGPTSESIRRRVADSTGRSPFEATAATQNASFGSGFSENDELDRVDQRHQTAHELAMTIRLHVGKVSIGVGVGFQQHAAALSSVPGAQFYSEVASI
jgi:hypothetical protein